MKTKMLLCIVKKVSRYKLPMSILSAKNVVTVPNIALKQVRIL